MSIQGWRFKYCSRAWSKLSLTSEELDTGVFEISDNFTMNVRTEVLKPLRFAQDNKSCADWPT